MYNLIYTVPFTNVDGEALTIQILEDGGTGTPVELTGGTPPFIVDVNDEDFLYNPTRFSGATLKLVGSKGWICHLDWLNNTRTIFTGL